MNRIRKHRKSSLLTLAGATVALPASATMVSHPLATPLTVGGPELIAASPVTEGIYFNPKTGAIGTWRDSGSSSIPAFASDLIILQTQTSTASNSKPAVIAAGDNTQMLTLGTYSPSQTAKPDLPPTFLPERLDAGRSIGADSKWGYYKPAIIDSTSVAVGLGVLADLTGNSLDITPAQSWGNGARGSLGFVMDALISTGNTIQTEPSTWNDPLVPESVPEFIPSPTPLYGWAEIGVSSAGLTLYGYAYEDSGASITTTAVARIMEISAVPEPANVLTLASLLGGSLLLRSRRRAPASTADA